MIYLIVLLYIDAINTVNFNFITSFLIIIIVFYYYNKIYDSKILCLIKIETIQRVRYIDIIVFPK